MTTRRKNSSSSSVDSLGVEDAEDVLSPHRHLDVVDYYTTLSLEDAATEDIMGDLEDQRLSALRSSTCSWEGLLACWHRVRSFAPSLWFFLVCVAVLAAAMGYLLDFLVDRLQTAQLTAVPTPALGFYISYIMFGVLFCVVAVACGHLISAQVTGSGIPEMKAFLAGAELPKYLAFRTLIGKSIGLVFALSSGLSIGKEGPFVHITSCIANQLFRLPWFAGLSRNVALQRQLFAAAIACGVTMAFGTPVGGVFFSIEVTSTYFLVASLWKSFFCATWAVVALKTFGKLGAVTYFDKTELKPFEMGWEVMAYALLGLLCGLLSVCFVYVSYYWMLLMRSTPKLPGAFRPRVRRSSMVEANGIVSRRRRSDSADSAESMGWCGACCAMLSRCRVGGRRVFSPLCIVRASSCWNWTGYTLHKLVRMRYAFPVAVVVLTSVLALCLPTLQGTDKQTIDAMFQTVDLDDGDDGPWRAGSFSLYVRLLLFLVLKTLLTSLSICLPLPCGVLTPVFAMGACFGRMWGELLRQVLSASAIAPGSYAVVGAAALTAGVTRSLSIAIIVFELTGQLTMLVPVLIGVLVAYSLSGGLMLSIYDVILNVKGLPFLPTMARTNHRKTVQEIMQAEFPTITQKTTYAELIDILHHPLAGEIEELPCISSGADPVLLATVSKAKLLAMVQQREDSFRRRLPPAELEVLDQYLERSDAQRQLQFEQQTEQGSGMALPRAVSTRALRYDQSGTSMWASVVHWMTRRRSNPRVNGSAASSYHLLPVPSREPQSSTTPTAEAVQTDGVAATVHCTMEYEPPVDSKEPDSGASDEATVSEDPTIAQYRNWMASRVNFMELSPVNLDHAPLTFRSKTPLSRLHFYFAMLSLPQAFVTNDRGQLLGLVTKASLQSSGKASKQKNRASHGDGLGVRHDTATVHAGTDTVK